MNPLLSEASNSVEGGWLLGLMTVVFLLTFIYWLWYAYAPRHRERMEAAGQMPFEVEDDLSTEGTHPGGSR